MRLIRSELMKLRTTNIWWLFLIGVLFFTGIMLFIWIFAGQEQLNQYQNGFTPPPAEIGVPPDQVERERQEWLDRNQLSVLLPGIATQIYTAGQYFTLLFVMLLGAIMVTNEFFQQTATATFLTTPQRTKVILAKLGTAVIAAGLFFILVTAINVAIGSVFFTSNGYGTQLDVWQVQRAILMNGLAFALWGILGVGLGVLIRNQIGTVVTATVSYVIGTAAVATLFALVNQYWIKEDWVMRLQVLWPSTASQIMISPDLVFEGAPVWWTGALVLVGYAAVFGLVGTLITRRRDIS
jgi:hypothetical protein